MKLKVMMLTFICFLESRFATFINVNRKLGSANEVCTKKFIPKLSS